MGQTQAAGGYFSKVELVPAGRPTRIDLTRVPGSPPVPPPMMKLAADVQTTARLVTILFEHDAANRDDFLRQLHITADTGLRGPNADVDAGGQNLAEVRESIASAFVVVRGHYYWCYFWCFVCLGLPTLLLGGLVYFAAYIRTGNGVFPFGLEPNLTWLPHIDDIASGYPLWVIVGLSLFWIPTGALLGIFLEFMLRVDSEIPYDKLAGINPGRWQVAQRLINTVVVAYVFALVLGASIFQVGVATVLLNEFSTTRPCLALLVGFVTGFSFSYVRDILYRIKPEVRSS